MKKVFAFFVCAIFLLSIVSIAEARRSLAVRSHITPERLNALTATDVAKVRHLDRASLRSLNNLDTAAISSRLSNVNVVNVPKNMLLKKRVISSNVMATVKQNLQQVQTNLVATKNAFLTAKQNYQATLSEYIPCKATNTAGCNEVKERILVHVKEFALKTAESLLYHVQQLKLKVSESEDIPQEKADSILAELNALEARLQEIIDSVQAAETREELRTILATLRNIAKEIRYKFALNKHKYTIYRANGLLQKLEILNERKEKIIEHLNDQGINVDDLESFAESFDTHLAEAKDKFHQANKKLKEAMTLREAGNLDESVKEQIHSLSAEAKQLFKEMIDLLKQAHDILIDFMKEAHGLLHRVNIEETGQNLLDPEATVSSEISEVEGGSVSVLQTEEGFVASLTTTSSSAGAAAGVV